MQPTPALRTAAHIALGALLLGVVGSLIFWQERALYLDAPHIFFRIINENSLQIQEGRIGSFITQGIPLLGARMGLSLTILLALYSLSFPLFYLLAGLILYRACRRYDLVILLAAYHTLLCTTGWYWTNNEVHQGVTWLLLGWGITQRLKSVHPAIGLIIFAGATYLALFTHPLVMIPAVCLWGMWVIIDGLPWRSRYWNIAATLLLVGLSIWKFSASAGSGGYETGKMVYVQNMKPIEVIHSFSGPVAMAFYRNLLVAYPGFFLLLLAGIGVAIRNKKFLLLSWCLACIIGHLVLLGLTYHSFEAWYMESEWMGFAIPGVGLLIYAARPGSLLATPVRIAGAGIILLQALLIGLRSGPFHQRILQSKRILSTLRESGTHKAILPQIPDTGREKLMDWDAPVQSQILSALAGDVPQYTFVFSYSPEDAAFKAALSKDSVWEAFGARPAARYNARYFQPDTTSRYVRLEAIAP